MQVQNTCVKVKANNSAKKDSCRNSPQDDKQLQFLIQQQLQAAQNFSSNQESIIVTVIPCGREDGKNSEEEMPFELKIKKKVNEHSLKEIFSRKSELWELIFKQHLDQESIPNFSIYRKPFEYEQDPSKSDLFLHILYMKSSEKALTRNYNAQELELFCHNRFYGPLVVAYNLNKTPYYLCNFTLSDLQNIEMINRNFQNKSIKDDYVPDCLIDFYPLRQDLDAMYKRGSMEIFTFYMFKYKSSWCPNKKDSHDSKSCIYAHHTRDFRRPPDIFKYLPEDCETLIKGVGWDKCDKGLKCNKCHTTVERLYHPDKYKRIFCDVSQIYVLIYPQKSRCNNSEICAFNHSQKEKQQALKECKNYRRQVDLKTLPDITDLSDKLLDFYRVQLQNNFNVSSLKSSIIEDCQDNQSSVRDSSSSSAKSQQTFENQQFDQNDMFQIQISPPHLNEVQYNPLLSAKNSNGHKQTSNLDKCSPMFLPSYRPQMVHQAPQMQQPIMHQPLHSHSHSQQMPNLYYTQAQQQYSQHNQMIQQQMMSIQNFNLLQYNQQLAAQQMMMKQQIQFQNGNSPPQQQIQVNNMQQIQLITSNNLSQTLLQNNYPILEEKIKEGVKMQVNFFEYGENDDMKTRNSTFSKASEGREEIKKNCVSFLEKAFILESNPINFLNPLDEEENAYGTPNAAGRLNRQPSGKSPSNFASPIILDFLEDDNFFQVDEARTKSKTEFARRDRQESQDSNNEDFTLIGDAQDYLNSILPNNSIQFKKHSQSRFSFSNQKRR